MSSLLDHWHPVLLSCDLRDQPKRVVVDDVAMAVFRSSPGQVAALTDVCPHRGMSLSMGKVCHGKLRCLYHGWSFEPDGYGESPGTPRMKTECDSYEACEQSGLVWVRRRGATTSFPSILDNHADYLPMVQMVHEVDAPLELVLDNFNELEHTSTTHSTFGYPLGRMQEVALDLVGHDDSVDIRYHGPSKPYDFLTRLFLGIGRDVTWHIEGVTTYSPVMTYGEYRWWDNRRHLWSPVGVANVHILTPVSSEKTTVFTLGFMKPVSGWRKLAFPLVKRLMRRQYIKEVNEDQRVLNGLADKTVSLEGMKLSRFDRVMGMNRQRINKLYRRIHEAPSMRPKLRPQDRSDEVSERSNQS